MLCNSWRKWRKWQWPKGLVKLIHYFRFTFSINRQPHPPHLRSSSCTRRTRTSGKRQRSWWGWRGLFEPEMLKPLFGIVVFVRSLIASETSTRITNAVKIYSNLLVLIGHWSKFLYKFKLHFPLKTYQEGLKLWILVSLRFVYKTRNVKLSWHDRTSLCMYYDTFVVKCSKWAYRRTSLSAVFVSVTSNLLIQEIM